MSTVIASALTAKQGRILAVTARAEGLLLRGGWHRPTPCRCSACFHGRWHADAW